MLLFELVEAQVRRTPERIAIFSCGCGDAVAIAVANSMN